MPDEDTLSELFARDPFKYSEQDEDRLIAYYRQKYAAFSVTGKGSVDKPAVDLKDLGLL